jgi:HD-GYP domain-containing protein (c-di-GMP phosphodiesterase class II)
MEPTLAKDPNFDEELLRLSSEMDAFEGYTYAHGLRIAAIADEIGKSFNLAAHDRLFMQQAALVHDLGELVMGRDYIKQNRALTAAERLDMQRHPVIGEQEAAKRGFSRGVQLLIRWHQEWWNGSGYPDALEGEQIPLTARILRVADSFAALRDDRPRRKAMSVEEAKRHLAEWAGLEFDPKVVNAFLSSGYIDTFEVRTAAAGDEAVLPAPDPGVYEGAGTANAGGGDAETASGAEENERYDARPWLEPAPADEQPAGFKPDHD